MIVREDVLVEQAERPDRLVAGLEADAQQDRGRRRQAGLARIFAAIGDRDGQAFVLITQPQLGIEELAGLQVALTALLREFNPEGLKQRLEQRSRLANLMPGSSKARYWELYEMFYKEVAAEAEQGFHGLFGREFRRAYEEQLKKL